MDRSSKYVIAIENEEVGYRDYFAELISLVFRAFSSNAFRLCFTIVAFIFGFIFTIGVVGGIERNLIPYICAFPLSVMLICVSLLLNKLRK